LPIGRPETARRVATLLRRNVREIVLLVVIVVVSFLTALKSSGFLSASNLQGIGLAAGMTFLVGLGEASVIVTRNIDASIGSMTGLVAYVSADAMSHHPGLGIGGVAVIGLCLGAMLGSVNGYMVARRGFPSILVTLGTLYVYLGALYTIAGAQEIVTTSFPSSYQSAATGLFGGVPLICWYSLILGLAVHGFLRYTRRGRYWLAVGSNPNGARVLALRPSSTIFTSYVFSGMCCGIVGVLWGAVYPTVDASAGSTVLLGVLAAVLVGGVSIWGGQGSVPGIALGAILLALLESALIVLGVSPFWESAVQGGVIVVAISLKRETITALQRKGRGLRGERKVREPSTPAATS